MRLPDRFENFARLVCHGGPLDGRRTKACLASWALPLEHVVIDGASGQVTTHLYELGFNRSRVVLLYVGTDQEPLPPWDAPPDFSEVADYATTRSAIKSAFWMRLWDLGWVRRRVECGEVPPVSNDVAKSRAAAGRWQRVWEVARQRMLRQGERFIESELEVAREALEADRRRMALDEERRRRIEAERSLELEPDSYRDHDDEDEDEREWWQT
jgi:hypothetical protein